MTGSRDWPDRVRDILDAIAVVQQATDSVTYEEFAADRVLVQAVLYSLAVIGEAIAGIPEELRARYPQVPWRQIRETRNIVIHVYFGVNLEIVWDTVEHDLAPVAEELRRILSTEGPPGDRPS